MNTLHLEGGGGRQREINTHKDINTERDINTHTYTHTHTEQGYKLTPTPAPPPPPPPSPPHPIQAYARGSDSNLALRGELMRHAALKAEVFKERRLHKMEDIKPTL
ncbi:unnamed protein product [Gadus morhua 'NCC']